ncbi:radical SAM protein [Sphingomonas zeae]
MRSYSGGYGDLVEETDDDEIVFPPLELLRAAAVLNVQGFEAEVFDLQVLPAQPLPRRTDAVIVSLSMPTLEEDCESLRRYKAMLGASRSVVLTSIADAALLREIAERSGADAVFAPRDIPSVAGLCSGAPLAAVTAYVPPDRSLIDNSVYRFSPLTDIDGSLRLVTAANASFGCPYPCGYYCPYPAAEGTKFKPVPLDVLVAELQAIKALGIDGVVFRDPTFSLDMPRIATLCDEIERRGIALAWWCETRLDRLDEALLAKMALAGCRGIEVGVESGDPASQASNTRKHLDLDRLVAIRDHANRLGIKMQFLFIVGLPGDERRNIVNTYRFIVGCGLDTSEFNLSTITPYPGTQFYEDASARGWFSFKPDRMTGYRANSRTDKLTVEEIAIACRFGDDLRAALDGGAEPGELDQLLGEMEDWAAAAAQ